jgi:hypothetical protein
MPSAIGGLTPEYRGADIRCGLNERLGCGTDPTFAHAAIADAASIFVCGRSTAAPQRSHRTGRSPASTKPEPTPPIRRNQARQG